MTSAGIKFIGEGDRLLLVDGTQIIGTGQKVSDQLYHMDLKICQPASSSVTSESQAFTLISITSSPSTLEGDLDSSTGMPTATSIELEAFAVVETLPQTQTAVKSLADPAIASVPICASFCTTTPTIYQQPETGQQVIADLLQTPQTYHTICAFVLHQIRHVQAILKCFGMLDSNSIALPLDSNVKLSSLSKDKASIDVPATTIGSLMCTTISIHLSVPIFDQTLFQFAPHFSLAHWTAIAHVPRCIKGTAAFGSTCNPNDPGLIGYSDADRAQFLAHAAQLHHLLLSANPVAVHTDTESTIAYTYSHHTHFRFTNTGTIVAICHISKSNCAGILRSPVPHSHQLALVNMAAC